MLRLILLLFHLAWGDIDNIFPPVYITNPVAVHSSYPILPNEAGECQLFGSDENDHVLRFYITTLPIVGKLYETSQSFRNYGTHPKNAPTPIEGSQLPFLVTDPLQRVVYVPPSNMFPPQNRWASFTFKVKNPAETWSEAGYCVLNNPNNYVASSSFVSDNEGWLIVGNLDENTPTHRPYGWGTLNRYLSCQDDVQFIDFQTGFEKQKWYFSAPEAFLGHDMVAAYGGTLRFTVKSTFGDFTYLNDPLDWVVLECEDCNNGDGIRLVRTTDGSLNWDGSEKTVEISLAAGSMWMRDPLNAAKVFREATDCEMVVTFFGLSKFKILGDWTQAGEGIAIDNISIEATSQQVDNIPVDCLKGCICRHVNVRRLSCCGND